MKCIGEKRMCIIVKYDGNALVQKEVLDLLLYAGAGRYSIDDHISLEPSQDGHKDAVFRIDSFCNWLLKECAIHQDTPFFIDEYLHAKVDKWYHRGDPKG